MRQILRMALHEFNRHVARRRFVIALLMPLIMIAVIGAILTIIFTLVDQADRGVIAYVDPQNALARASAPAGAANTFSRVETVDTARAMLRDGSAIAAFALAPDFASTRSAELLFWERRPSRDVERAFERFAATALVADRPPDIQRRIIESPGYAFASSDGSRVTDEIGLIAGFLIPLLMGLLFVVALFSGAQYLMQAVIEEKENRMMEVIVTSISPMQLMSGKVLGLAGVGLTQVVAWTSALLIALALAADRLPFLKAVRIEPGFVAVALLMFVLEYLLFSALMGAIGSLVTSAKDGQNLSSPVVLLSMTPWFVIPVFFIAPNGPVAVALSLFPLSAPLAMLLRYASAPVPFWQVILAMALLAASVAGALWLASRVFRIGMLEYGNSVSLKAVWEGLRG
jgi:ABC-2 type transport system permease protein